METNNDRVQGDEKSHRDILQTLVDREKDARFPAPGLQVGRVGWGGW